MARKWLLKPFRTEYVRLKSQVAEPVAISLRGSNPSPACFQGCEDFRPDKLRELDRLIRRGTKANKRKKIPFLIPPLHGAMIEWPSYVTSDKAEKSHSPDKKCK
ncbi:hypothetical protein CEXT_773341 [Caerostris extrusa]|uniref:Uncharacterized protein n=1 Tax=Caerostris extrusa TaxID=172846 RepID=A0AAV4MU68_CAEEX|nr:hypothetical protein CEXT_773341 [Caerostris extrusa]